MSNAELAVAPSQYVEFWNSVLVPKFVRWRHILVDGLTLHSAKVFPSLAVRPGRQSHRCWMWLRRYRDPARPTCGSQRIGPGDRLLRRFPEYGRRDAKAAGIQNVTFLEEDVQTYPFRAGPRFLLLAIRHAVLREPGRRSAQHADKPEARRHHDHDCLARHQRQSLARPCETVVLEFLPPPGDNAQTCGPGPFSMADIGVVTKQLEIAGYKDIAFEKVDAEVFVGNDLDDAVAFQLAIGPAGEVFREAGKVAEQYREEIGAALKAELAKYHGPKGIMMDSSSWKVTARNRS